MGYNINFDELRNMYERATAGTSMWQGNFNNVLESINGLIGDADFTGAAADAIKEYLYNVHVITMTAIEAMIAEFNSKIILYSDGLYTYETDYYAILNEDYLTSVIGKIGDMITYATETHETVQANIDTVSHLVDCDLKTLSSYTTSLSDAKQKLTVFRDQIGEHDADYAGANLENLRTLVQNTYDLVQRVREAGTITIGEIDYNNFYTMENLQDMIGQINSSFRYVNDNMNQIQESANHLTEIRVEINKRIEEEARKQRITRGIILVGECVLGLVSVVATCGADAPFVVVLIGELVAVDSMAKGIEGGQEIYYGLTGDIDTASINMVRDTMFHGDQTTYDVSMMIVNGVYGFSGSMGTIASAGTWGSAESITAAELELIKTVGNTGADHVGNYIAEQSNMGDLGKFVFTTTFSMAGGAMVDGGAEMLEADLYGFNSTRYYYDDRTTFHLNHVNFQDTVDIEAVQIPDTVDAVLAARTPGTNAAEVNGEPANRYAISGDVAVLNATNRYEASGRGVEGSLNSGLTKSKIEDIINTPKGSRPDPSSYLSQEYIDVHLAQFDDGVSVIQTDWAYSRYSEINGFVGVPDDNSLFVIPKNYCDDVIARANGNISIIEKELGFPEGYFSDGGGLIRIDAPNTAELNIRIPSGNETGANKLWIPGGKTSGGVPEAITNTIPLKDTTITRINID